MKIILMTGATDGIGRATADRLVAAGHRVILHGRNPAKLAAASDTLGGTETVQADLSRLRDAAALAAEIANRFARSTC